MAGFNVAGPLARDLLKRLTNADLSNEGFAFMRSAWIDVAGVPCIALRVSFTGDLGWELHCADVDQARLYAALLEAGTAIDAGPVGSRALMSLRIEKGYGSWGRDYSPEYWPQETGLAQLVKLEKPFLNRDACAEVMANPPREVLRTLVIEATVADATGGEPIFDLQGKPAGKVSSGAYGYHVDQSLALAYLRPDIAAGSELQVMVLGRPHPARVLAGAAFDPEGKRLRA
jgi:dimethylglycine dehydrogenase